MLPLSVKPPVAVEPEVKPGLVVVKFRFVMLTLLPAALCQRHGKVEDRRTAGAKTHERCRPVSIDGSTGKHRPGNLHVLRVAADVETRQSARALNEHMVDGNHILLRHPIPLRLVPDSLLQPNYMRKRSMPNLPCEEC